MPRRPRKPCKHRKPFNHMHELKTLPQSQVELTITVTPAEYESHLQKSAETLSKRVNIKGFRPGKVPFDVLKREVGDMNILQEALESIIQDTYYQAVIEEKLDVLGTPKIDIKKVAPGNDVVYTATVALLPTIKLPDISKINVQRDAKEVDDKQINETLDALRGMHATEVVKAGKAEKTDKLVLDLNMSIDNVPVEGGQAKDYQVYLSEEHYIPGFNEQVAGLKKDDEKEFSLDFPSTHYQKHLAGKTVNFKVKVKDVYERTLPEITDEFAKKLGQKDADTLRALVKSNLTEEAVRKADQKVEAEILETLIDKTTFSDIPEVLIDSERQKMFYELQRDLEKHGISTEQYLADIKKSEKELFEDFKQQAEKRAKAALVSRELAKEQHLRADDAEVDAEIQLMNNMYRDNAEYLENLKRPEVRDTIAVQIQNRKVMQWLKAKILGDQLINDPHLSELGCKDCKDHKHDHGHNHAHDGHSHHDHDHNHTH